LKLQKKRIEKSVTRPKDLGAKRLKTEVGKETCNGERKRGQKRKGLGLGRKGGGGRRFSSHPLKMIMKGGKKIRIKNKTSQSTSNINTKKKRYHGGPGGKQRGTQTITVKNA